MSVVWASSCFSTCLSRLEVRVKRSHFLPDVVLQCKQSTLPPKMFVASSFSTEIRNMKGLKQRKFVRILSITCVCKILLKNIDLLNSIFTFAFSFNSTYFEIYSQSNNENCTCNEGIAIIPKFVMIPTMEYTKS